MCVLRLGDDMRPIDELAGRSGSLAIAKLDLTSGVASSRHIGHVSRENSLPLSRAFVIYTLRIVAPATTMCEPR